MHYQIDVLPGRVRRKQMGHRGIVSLLLALLTACVPAQPRQAALERGTLAFTHVNLIPMTRDTVLTDMTVVVDGDHIVAIGESARLAAPSGARVIDGRGRFLMPGLADAHAHLVVTIGAEPAIRAAWHANNERLLQLGLSRGVTTILELGGVGLGPDPDRVLPELRRDIAAGTRLGPTVYLAWDKANDSAMTREAGMRLVDTAHASGYDVIKVYNALSLEGYRGIVLRAQQLGMPVVGHVVRSVGFEGTLGSGQHGIWHVEEIPYTYFGFRVTDTLQVPERVLDTSAIPYLARSIKRSGMWVTPTLVTSETVLAQVQNLDSVLARPEVRHIPRGLYDALWAPRVNPYATRFSHPRRVRNLEAGLGYQRALVRALHDAGVPMLIGTDAPAAGVVPGYALHDELRNFVDAGFTPYQALAAATVNVAAFLGHDDFGTIEVGRRADLLLLKANPLADVGNAQGIVGLTVRGRWLAAPDLQNLADAAGK